MEIKEDRISELPNEILVSILSFLPLKDAGRTSVLSKHWKDKWKLLVRLDFDASEALDKIAAIKNSMRHHIMRKTERRHYVKWVNRVLELYTLAPLGTLRICFDLDNAFKVEIDKWLLSALGRGVQRLELNLLKDGKRSCDPTKAYALPLALLGLNNLSKPTSLSNFKNLKALTFRCVDVSGEVLKFFLRSCPFLEHLAVASSNLLKNDFEVCGPSLSLKHLEISNCLKLKSISVHDIHIVSLKVISTTKLVLRDVPKLANAWISGKNENIGKAISCLSPCLFTLEALTLQLLRVYLNVRRGIPIDDHPELIRLKQLNFIVEGYADDCLIPFTYLIRLSPNLEKFVVKLDWTHLSEDAQEAKRSRRKVKCKGASLPLPNLKVVELLGYYGRIAEVELVDYLLDNSVVLERVVFDPRDQPMSGRHRYQDDKENGARTRAEEQIQQWIPSKPDVEFVLL